MKNSINYVKVLIKVQGPQCNVMDDQCNVIGDRVTWGAYRVVLYLDVLNKSIWPCISQWNRLGDQSIHKMHKT